MTQSVVMATNLAAEAGSFSAIHIAGTAALTGVLALGAAAWRLPRTAWPDVVAIGILSAAAVFLWRISANMPQLNSDGLPGFSANDWLAPVMTYIPLGIRWSSLAQRFAAFWPSPHDCLRDIAGRQRHHHLNGHEVPLHRPLLGSSVVQTLWRHY